MSALRPSGSTREWRRIVALVKARDAKADGTMYCAKCGVRLTTHDRRLRTHVHVGHKDARVDHPGGDNLDRLQLECLHCNTQDGARLANQRRTRPDATSRKW